MNRIIKSTAKPGPLIEEKVSSLKFLIDVAKDQVRFFKKLKETSGLEWSKLTINDKHVSDYYAHMNTVWNELSTQKYMTEHLLPTSEPLKCEKMNLMIELLWRVHMIHPLNYYNDCMKFAGDVIPFIGDKTRHNINKTNVLTELKELDSEEAKLVEYGNTESFIASIDLKSAFINHKSFINKMISTYGDIDSMTPEDEEKLLERYYKFLYLKMKVGNGIDKILVPRLEIDLIWHSHQLVPYHYHYSCVKLFGIDIFNHDDNIDSSILSIYESETESLWNKYFVGPGSQYKNDTLTNIENNDHGHLNTSSKPTLPRAHRQLMQVKCDKETMKCSFLPTVLMVCVVVWIVLYVVNNNNWEYVALVCSCLAAFICGRAAIIRKKLFIAFLIEGVVIALITAVNWHQPAVRESFIVLAVIVGIVTVFNCPCDDDTQDDNRSRARRSGASKCGGGGGCGGGGVDG